MAMNMLLRCSPTTRLLSPFTTRLFSTRPAASSLAAKLTGSTSSRFGGSDSTSTGTGTRTGNAYNNIRGSNTTPIPRIITDGKGRSYKVSDLTNFATKEKLKPHIVKKRLKDCRTYLGTEKGVRYSPYRMAKLCKFVAGLPLEEAILQLDFIHRGNYSPLMQKILRRTGNLADIRHGLPYSSLEVAECFATHGHRIKRIRYHAKGRHGIMRHRHSHVRLVLREIDFPLRIYMAKTTGEMRKWILLQQRAQKDYDRRKAETDEMERLEREVAMQQQAKDAKAVGSGQTK